MEELRNWVNPNPPPPELSMDPNVITDIIVEDCFHLKNSKGQVLYDYSEKTLQYLTRIGYEISEKKDHVLYMRQIPRHA